MPIPLSLSQATLIASIAVVSLAACRPETPPPSPPQPTTEVVTPNVNQTAASDRPDAPHAIGTVAAGQAGSGANRGPAQPTGGDAGASAPASAASR